jgi:hypothetical protein
LAITLNTFLFFTIGSGFAAANLLGKSQGCSEVFHSAQDRLHQILTEPKKRNIGLETVQIISLKSVNYYDYFLSSHTPGFLFLPY